MAIFFGWARALGGLVRCRGTISRRFLSFSDLVFTAARGEALGALRLLLCPLTNKPKVLQLSPIVYSHTQLIWQSSCHEIFAFAFLFARAFFILE